MRKKTNKKEIHISAPAPISCTCVNRGRFNGNNVTNALPLELVYGTCCCAANTHTHACKLVIYLANYLSVVVIISNN